jgi:hypothetical protein
MDLLLVVDDQDSPRRLAGLRRLLAIVSQSKKIVV